MLSTIISSERLIFQPPKVNLPHIYRHSNILIILTFFLETFKHWDTGLVSSGVSLTLQGEGTSLALAGHPSIDDITIKIPYVVEVLLHQPVSHSIFSYWVG